MCALLENNRTRASSFVGVGEEVSVIFSNSKDEPWSQYKHLHNSGKIENAKNDSRLHRSRVLLKWSDADINHRLAYIELWREIEQLNGRRNNRTSVKCELERRSLSNHKQTL